MCEKDWQGSLKRMKMTKSCSKSKGYHMHTCKLCIGHNREYAEASYFIHEYFKLTSSNKEPFASVK